ncbi:CLUMA_CG009482, isoform A [Clunio marinus]|uniref:CLUMA_CG009482, isoform A n=1 Tax=Clunio marinus TaxID=568069 RepID=A0A1J1I6Z2_9DIPT|nr:CLUMA_CG009482, isoform A [Clunio marinus]
MMRFYKKVVIKADESTKENILKFYAYDDDAGVHDKSCYQILEINMEFLVLTQQQNEGNFHVL